ncbi:MAG: hypothetical protein M0006_09570 [Magnetospirillum sp.]|nr:hypothetical protein [Magnetospirillum sp.]
MIIDGFLQFDPAGTAITAGGPSTNTIDLGSGRDLGIGDDALQVVVHILETFAAAGAATLDVQVQSSVDNVTWTTLVESGAIPVADLVAGKSVLRTALPLDQPAVTAGIGRYLRLNYVVATGPMTAGQVQAAVVIDRQANVAYPPGVTVSN